MRLHDGHEFSAGGVGFEAAAGFLPSFVLDAAAAHGGGFPALVFLPRFGLHGEGVQAVGFGEGAADLVELFFGGGGAAVAGEGAAQALGLSLIHS